MLNTIWAILIITAFIFSFISGKVNDLNSGIFDSAYNAVNTSITFLGTICLWSGLMRILQETTIIDKINNLLSPIMKLIFPKMKKNSSSYHNITMNMSANILGLGNAATPLGIKAMETLQAENEEKERLSDDMMLFIVLNTASIQLIPTTVIAIRASLGSENPAEIIIPIWIVTIIADSIGIFITKILIKKQK